MSLTWALKGAAWGVIRILPGKGMRFAHGFDAHIQDTIVLTHYIERHGVFDYGFGFTG